MEYNNKSDALYVLYNLARFLFLKIEYDYNADVEKNFITLPQLRVLWIVKVFPDISPGKIAKIGCWTPPTVTNMMKLLEKKGLIAQDKKLNKKNKNIFLTQKGIDTIENCKHSKGDDFPNFYYNKFNSLENIEYLISILSVLPRKYDNIEILTYIEKVSTHSLKVNFDSFTKQERISAKNFIILYNYIRFFVLTVQNNHSVLLKQYDITYPQIRALRYISAIPGITSLELSHLAFWSPSTANLIVRNLNNKGFIEKERGPYKNYLYLYTNDKGKSLLHEDRENNYKSIEALKMVDENSLESINRCNTILYELNKSISYDLIDSYVKTFNKQKI